MILTLHLLIIQVITWVLVPSDTLLGPLCVGAANVALFKSLFRINVARKLAVEHLMRW